MDSLTQIVLGAAVGEYVLGKKIGNKAALWGAVAGTIPDLDVLAALILDPVDYLSVHRGFSHSIFFPFIIAPVLGYLLKTFDKSAAFKEWSLLFFWSIATHPILDLFTGYGTQIFNPLSSYAFELNTIFIIDPLFTFPLLVLLLSSLFFSRTSIRRRKLNTLGLYLSCGYLVLTILFKITAYPVFIQALQHQHIEYTRIMTIPGPFTSIYWRALVETEHGYYEGYYSLLQKDNQVVFFYTPRNAHLIKQNQDDAPVKKLLWFSKGFYHISKSQNTLYFNDLRFGSYNGWKGEVQNFVFSFELVGQPNFSTFRQVQNPIEITEDDLMVLFSMIFNPNSFSEQAERRPSL